jgi:RNA polymerase-binding transcription factor DksA
MATGQRARGAVDGEDLALARIQDGTYGSCTSRGNAIKAPIL